MLVAGNQSQDRPLHQAISTDHHRLYRRFPRHKAPATLRFDKTGFAVLLDKQAKRLHFLFGPTTFAE